MAAKIISFALTLLLSILLIQTSVYATDPISGVCGTVHGQTLASAPTTNLCNAGIPSDVGGIGPWIWRCSGSDGGSTADCIASIVPLEGDVNGDRAVNLADAILALKMITGGNPSGFATDNPTSDINDDGKIGLPDIIYILQRIGELRSPSLRYAVGSVTLPAGSPLTPGDVQVQSFLGSGIVQTNGTYSVPQPSEGLAVVTLTDPQGHVMLMGYADAGDSRMGKISSLSTATALMFLDLGGPILPAEIWKEVLAMVESEGKVKDLAAVIETRLALDSAALENGDPAIKTAVEAARNALVPASEQQGSSAMALSAGRRALDTDPIGITVVTANPASGIRVDSEPKGDGLLIQNQYRRNCYYWLYYTGYQDKSGTDHLLSSALWEKVDDGYLKSTGGLSGVIGTSLDYFVWEKLPYNPVKVGPFILDKAPADAKHGYYKAVIAGGTTILGALPPEWVMENVHRADYFAMQQLMGIVTVVKDYFLPLAFALAPPDLTKSWTGREVAEFCQLLLNFFIKAGANVSQNINSNDYNGAWKALEKALLADGDLRKAVCKFIAAKALKYAVSPERLEQVSTTAGNFAKILKGFDIAMLAWDLGAVKKDLLLSNGYEYFDVIAVKPNIHVEPAAITLIPKQEKTFNAIKGTVAGDTFEYRWTVTGIAGSLRKPDGTTLSNTQTTDTPGIVYKAADSPMDKAQDTITVEVYRKFITDTGVITQHVGTGNAVVTILNSPTDGIPVTYHFIGPYYWSNGPFSIGDWNYTGYIVTIAYFTWPAVEGAYAYQLGAIGARYNNGEPRPYQSWGISNFGWHRDRLPIPANFPYPEIPPGTIVSGTVVLDGVTQADMQNTEWVEAYSSEMYLLYRDTYNDATITAVPKFWGQ
jgi:hypothetical protein